jgi:hypothetical protein
VVRTHSWIGDWAGLGERRFELYWSLSVIDLGVGCIWSLYLRGIRLVLVILVAPSKSIVILSGVLIGSGTYFIVPFGINNFLVIPMISWFCLS